MKNPKEGLGSAKAGQIGKKDVSLKGGKSTGNLKVCHPSVCIGNQKPTSCVCISEK